MSGGLRFPFVQQPVAQMAWAAMGGLADKVVGT